MGLIQKVGNGEWSDVRLTPKEVEDKKLNASEYAPSDDERSIRAMLIRHFTFGYETMYKPRREFNDMSVIGRMTIDQMSFNTYQPNNGEAPEGDLIDPRIQRPLPTKATRKRMLLGSWKTSWSGAPTNLNTLILH